MRKVRLEDIFLSPTDYSAKDEKNEWLDLDIKRNGVLSALQCKMDGSHIILKSESLEMYQSCKRLGISEVPIEVQGSDSTWDKLRAEQNVVQWSMMAAKLTERHGVEMVISQSHLPRSVVLDRLETARLLSNVQTTSQSDPLELARNIRNFMALNPTLGTPEVAKRLEYPTTRILDLLAMLRLYEEGIARAEKHGKVLGRQEKTQEDAEKRGKEELVLIERLTRKEKMYSQTEVDQTVSQVKRSTQRTTGFGLCIKCNDQKAVANCLCIDCIKLQAVEESRTPAERGLVRCLEAACPKWIKSPQKRTLPLQATYYFCKEHQVSRVQSSTDGGQDNYVFRTPPVLSRSIASMPELDRDGDPIWVTREMDVIKICQMEDSHLTNCLTFIEGAAKRRCQITGIDESKWPEKTTPRYAHLVVEAKRRDEKLKCLCRDGVTDTKTVTEGKKVTVIETLCDQCQIGRDRAMAKKLAEKIAKDREGQKAITVKMAVVIIMAMIAGGLASPGSHIVEWFVYYLRMAGCVK